MDYKSIENSYGKKSIYRHYSCQIRFRVEKSQNVFRDKSDLIQIRLFDFNHLLSELLKVSFFGELKVNGMFWQNLHNFPPFIIYLNEIFVKNFLFPTLHNFLPSYPFLRVSESKSLEVNKKSYLNTRSALLHIMLWGKIAMKYFYMI